LLRSGGRSCVGRGVRRARRRGMHSSMVSCVCVCLCLCVCVFSVVWLTRGASECTAASDQHTAAARRSSTAPVLGSR
jgi:hypothetical protein